MSRHWLSFTFILLLALQSVWVAVGEHTVSVSGGNQVELSENMSAVAATERLQTDDSAVTPHHSCLCGSGCCGCCQLQSMVYAAPQLLITPDLSGYMTVISSHYRSLSLVLDPPPPIA